MHKNLNTCIALSICPAEQVSHTIPFVMQMSLFTKPVRPPGSVPELNVRVCWIFNRKLFKKKAYFIFRMIHASNQPAPTFAKLSQAACKRTQHCWPTTSKIFGCYILRQFAHLVSYCCVLLEAAAQSLKPVKL